MNSILILLIGIIIGSQFGIIKKAITLFQFKKFLFSSFKMSNLSVLMLILAISFTFYADEVTHQAELEKVQCEKPKLPVAKSIEQAPKKPHKTKEKRRDLDKK